jgi:hypothetical protein
MAARLAASSNEPGGIPQAEIVLNKRVRAGGHAQQKSPASHVWNKSAVKAVLKLKSSSKTP